MANRIKGITVEISGDTTKLENALKGVNSQIKTTESELKDVNKLLKLDPGNTELITQKHRLLGDAVKETKEKLETLKVAAKDANDALSRGEITQSQYDALQREIAETEQALKDLEKQAGESETALQKIAATGEKLKSVGDNIANAGSTLTKNVTAPIVGLGTIAVKTAADFDTAMSKVAAVSGATGSDLDNLRAKAREMGSKTKFSASEAAEAMNYMAMAGWKTEDMLSGIEGVMNLAAASGEELGTTSDIVTDALTAFGLTAKDSGHFADVLAAASSNANTNVSMMGETFKYAAPIAGAMGYSIEDTAEAIGLMANAGIKSSQAGTSLRKIMTELNGEIKISGEQLGETVIQTSNADGSMRSLGDILSDCRAAFSKLTESEQASTAEALVGKTAMSGFLALMNAAPSDIEKLNSAITNCNGSSQKMADTMQDNLAGQLTILKSQLQELAISFGELLMPAVKNIVSAIQGFVDGLNKMSPEMKNTIVTIALVAAAVGPVLIIVGKVISAIGTIMTIIPKLSGAITAVKTAFSGLGAVLAANPFVLIIGAIVALVAAFIYFWNTSEEFRQFWINLWEKVKEVVGAAIEAIGAFLSGLWDAIVNACTAIGQAIGDFLTMVCDLFVNIWTGIVDIVSGIWTTITGVISGAMQAIYDTVTAIWDAICSVVGGILEGLVSILSATWEVISSVVTTVFTAIADFITTIWTGISEFLSTIWEGISALFSTVLGTIFDVVSSIWNAMADFISTVMNTIFDVIGSVWNSVLSGVSDTIGNIVGVIMDGFNAAVDFITGLIGQAFSWGADLIGGIIDGIGSAIGGIGDAIGNVASGIASFLHFSRPDKGPLHEYETWMPDFMGGLAAGIEKSRGMVQKAMGDVAGDMVLSPNVSSEINAGGDTGVVELTQPIMMDGRVITSIVSQIQYKNGQASLRNLGTV